MGVNINCAFLLTPENARARVVSVEVNMETKTPIGFMAACKQYFGMLPGQTLMEFKKEMDAVPLKDRLELKPGLEAAIGVPVDCQPPKA